MYMYSFSYTEIASSYFPTHHKLHTNLSTQPTTVSWPVPAEISVAVARLCNTCSMQLADLPTSTTPWFQKKIRPIVVYSLWKRWMEGDSVKGKDEGGSHVPSDLAVVTNRSDTCAVCQGGNLNSDWLCEAVAHPPIKMRRTVTYPQIHLLGKHRRVMDTYQRCIRMDYR